MRICFIANCAILGGAERVLLETMDVLIDRGVDCRALVPVDGELAEELRRMQVPVTFARMHSWVMWGKPRPLKRIRVGLGMAASLLPIAKEIRKWQFDLVYSNTLAVCTGSLVAGAIGVPHVWHLHEFGREDHGLFYNFGEGVSNATIGRLSSACIVVSKALARKYAPYVSPSK